MAVPASLRRCFAYSSKLYSSTLLPRIHLPTVVSTRTSHFWEKDRKGGYKTAIRKPVVDRMKEGFQMLGPEMVKFKDEVVYKWSCEELWVNAEHGDYEIMWQFDSQEAIDEFIVTRDSDHNQGKSDAEFVLSRNQTGLFQGYLNTETPKDGIIIYAGYASIRSPRKMKSFKRTIPYDFENFTHMLIRYRGDGRAYAVVLGLDREYDVQWNDQYNYALFTRGGPYWQIAKIPLSKFFLAAYGRIQDQQDSFMYMLSHVSNVSITLGDGNLGPFQLEIDFIGFIKDESHIEHTAYEMYTNPPATAY